MLSLIIKYKDIILYYNMEENNDSYIDNSNPEFVEFKRDVKDWIALDDDIKTLTKAIRDRKKQKQELTPKVLNFMDEYKVHDVKTTDGQLKFSKSLTSKPINKKYLVSRLGDFFKDYSRGEKAVDFIYENRDKQEKLSLKRIIKK
tara:strand:- start:983 stop:1417 length:435 start_codon:yes stop_codon:yes gene_type:complete